MSNTRVERRLAAILAADVVGFSRLTQADEEGSYARLKRLYVELIEPRIAEYRGRTVKLLGDGALVEFASAVNAVRCAVEVQHESAKRNAALPPDQRIELRIGINIGDIIIDGDDIHGDGVIVAVRLEGLCAPGAIYVTGNVFDQVSGKLDVPFSDLGERALKNINRPVRVFRVGPVQPDDLAAHEDSELPALSLPDKPAIAVLPFANMSGDAGQEYFADGMVEEIITSLSRIKWLFVIARSSSFKYKGRSLDVKQIGRELGVRYVLEGSVRNAGGRVRITGQLIDAVTGAHLWAENFNGSLDDIFEIQDQVAVSVAGAIEPALVAAEIRRSAERPTTDSTAYDLYLRALAHTHTWQKEGVTAALELLEQAVARDAGYGPALALAARCHIDLHVNGWSEDPEANRTEGIALAYRALRTAGDNPAVLSNAAYSLAYFGEDIDAAMALIDRALALNPSYARGWVESGWLRLWAGDPELAVTHFEASLRLSPAGGRVGASGAFMPIGVAYFFSRRFDDAIRMLLRAMHEHPTWAPTYRFLAACYAHAGRLDDARAIVDRLRALTPIVMPRAMQYRNPEHREFFLEGLRLACGET